MDSTKWVAAGQHFADFAAKSRIFFKFALFPTSRDTLGPPHRVFAPESRLLK
jgi:hypothetical protein